MSKYVIAALCAALLAATGATLHYRGNAARSDAQAEHVSAQLEQAASDLVIATGEAAAYRTQSQALNEIGRVYEQNRQAAQRAADAAIADLRNGNLRLQSRFQCPPVPAEGTATGASVGDGGAHPGFTEQDAAIALRIAGDGDEAIHQLAACQAVIRAYIGEAQ
ncbi:MAG: lysis protein [Xanthomonadaceae bacterium]|jgi:hypothetical protein|nr:lysis protein [Xanthomonadaceae bacterium]